MRVYDCRHACATTWLSAGVPFGEVARRLGHSVETLVGTYVGALDGDYTAANELIDFALGPSRAWIADIGSVTPASPPAALPRTTVNPGEQGPTTVKKRKGRDLGFVPGHGLSGGAPSAGFEPAHTAPEADALSPELRGQGRTG